MLRKRESDGTTIISLQNCDETPGAASHAQKSSSELKQTYFDPNSIGMQPVHPGLVANRISISLRTIQLRPLRHRF
jgi:hypothetical protein